MSARPPRPRLPRSLAGQLFAMQVVLVTLLVAGCALFTYLSGLRQAEEAARRQATTAARAVADAPTTREAATGADPTAVLQPYAEQVREDTGVDFVTIMDRQGVRWTHPDTRRIGRPFLGHTEESLAGHTFTETYAGTLGPSVRVVTPIRADGEIVGLVSAGITVERISERVREQLALLLAVAVGTLAAGGAGTYAINARLRRHTHGMNATELGNMHDYHQATLHAVREGLLMLDRRRRVALVNDGGRELLGIGDSAVGRPVADLGLPPALTGALLDPEPQVDEMHLSHDRLLLVNTQPVSGGRRRGTVVTLRDHTELQSLTGELDSERGFTRSLRAQAHEAANRLHTVISLIELGRAEEAVEFATAELELAQALTDRVVHSVGEPVLAALLLGKAAQSHERGVELVVTEDSLLDDGVLPASLPPRDLVTVLGNLLDNAVDAAQESALSRVTATVRTEGAQLLLEVADSGPGVDPVHQELLFRAGWSTKSAETTKTSAASASRGRGLGLALVRQAVTRHGGILELDEAADGGARFTVLLPLEPAQDSVHAGSAHAVSVQAGSAHAGSAQAGSAQAGSAHAGSAHAGSAQAAGSAPAQRVEDQAEEGSAR